jgi:uncharacterized protein (DUF2141 family)
MAAPALVGATGEAGTSVQITVISLRSHEGVVRACMTDDVAHFPRCREDAGSYRVVMSAGEPLVLDFGRVAPGRYAVALLHDENNNGQADRAAGMIPREGFGFSRDAKVRMAPPPFEAAAFDVGVKPVRQTVRMRYML